MGNQIPSNFLSMNPPIWNPHLLHKKITQKNILQNPTSCWIKQVKFWNPKFCTQISIPTNPLRKTPRRGGRQQPHQTLKKSKKYKGGKKHHTMVMQSAPKMPKWHHSTLKAWSILAWILRSRVDQRKLMAFQVAIPTSTVATQDCWRIFLEEYWLSKCFQHLFVQRK